MKIIPAIDLKDGMCVRLLQGDYEKVTVFNEDPVSVALKFKVQGAKLIHLVDLDGAKEGHSINGDIVKKIASMIDVELGGGIRTLDDIKRAFAYGVTRIILGSAAVKDFSLVEKAIQRYGSDKIVVGVDAKDGYVAINGWREITDIKAFDFCKKLESIHVKTVIYTDISKDGMMQGVNLEETKHLIDHTSLNIIASGGISNMNDVNDVYDIGAHGVILGKSLYLGTIDLVEAIKFEDGESDVM